MKGSGHKGSFPPTAELPHPNNNNNNNNSKQTRGRLTSYSIVALINTTLCVSILSDDKQPGVFDNNYDQPLYFTVR